MKVVCINDVFRQEQKDKLKYLPKKGVEYTVIEEYDNPTGDSGYVLEELPNPVLSSGLVPNFRKSRFKPCEDISSLIETKIEEYAG